jgi:hypothetical protein
MDIFHWLARSAARLLWRKPASPTHDDQRARRHAARSLCTRLSAHLLRDIGADDG